VGILGAPARISANATSRDDGNPLPLLTSSDSEAVFDTEVCSGNGLADPEGSAMGFAFSLSHERQISELKRHKIVSAFDFID